jgi:hypothetical protein
VSAGQQPWWDRAMRWAQLTLVDDDPRPGSGYSGQEWIDYFREIRADAACLSAGGYMAFYPTRIPGHRRSIHLGDTDPFGELVEGSRRLGLVVMARVDPHAIHDDVFRDHPEWVAVNPDGTPRPHWSAPGVWLTCPFGPWSTEFISAVNTEIMRDYDVDAIFANRWAGSGRCYCEVCRRRFRDATGYEIPLEGAERSSFLLSPEERAYAQWRETTLLEIVRQWDSEIRAIRPDARFIPNSGGGVLSDIDMSKLGAQVDTLFADKQARSGLSPSWTAGRHGKEFAAVMGAKPVGGIFSMGIEEVPRWKDSVQTAEEIGSWVGSATANGLRPWFTKFGGALVDRRWLPVVRDIYHWHADNERYLRNTAPIADVGLVYSQQTARIFGASAAKTLVEEPIHGFYHALVEARIPFRMIHDQLFDAENLAGLRVLVLPNVASLSDAQLDLLRAFVARGGSIVATAETSLYREDGSRRDDLGLADLFGASVTGPLRENAMNSYLTLHPDRDDAEHPVLGGLRGVTRIINGTSFLETAPLAGDTGVVLHPVTLVDTFPDLPMEEVYPRDRAEGPPQLYLSRRGQGRVAYLPGALDRAFVEFLARDHFLVLEGIIGWARAAEPLVEVIGKGIVEVTAWEQESSMTVHVVNHTNPMYLKGPFHEVLPSPPQHVRIAIPAGRSVTEARLLRSGRPVDATISGGLVEIELPPIDDFEVIALDLA